MRLRVFKLRLLISILVAGFLSGSVWGGDPHDFTVGGGGEESSTYTIDNASIEASGSYNAILADGFTVRTGVTVECTCTATIAGPIVVEAGGILVVTGDGDGISFTTTGLVTNNGEIFIWGKVTNEGNLINHGLLRIGNNDLINTGTLTNHGIINNGWNFNNLGTINNNGSLLNYWNFVNQKTLNNYGTITSTHYMHFGDYDEGGDAVNVDNYGSITCAPVSETYLYNSSEANLSTLIIYPGGMVTVSTGATFDVQIGGKINMVDEPSILYLNGCNFYAGVAGITLTKGTVIFDNTVHLYNKARDGATANVDPTQAIKFGDGTNPVNLVYQNNATVIVEGCIAVDKRKAS